MPEQKLSQRETTTVKAGGYLHIILPTVTPNVFESKKISVDSLLSGTGGLQPLRYANVQDYLNVPIPSNCIVQTIHIKTITGLPTVKIGTSPNGNELLDTYAIVGGYLKVDASQPFFTIGALSFYVLNGTVDIRIDYTNNLF